MKSLVGMVHLIGHVDLTLQEIWVLGRAFWTYIGTEQWHQDYRTVWIDVGTLPVPKTTVSTHTVLTKKLACRDSGLRLIGAEIVIFLVDSWDFEGVYFSRIFRKVKGCWGHLLNLAPLFMFYWGQDSIVKFLL